MANPLSNAADARVALPASTDLYNGDPVSDYYKLDSFRQITFVVEHGSGAVGTATYTVLAAEDAAGTNAEAIAFKSRVHPKLGRQGELTDEDTAGFTITAGADQIAVIEVPKGNLPAGGAKKYVALKLTEVADDPVVGSVMAILSDYDQVSGDFPLAFL